MAPQLVHGRDRSNSNDWRATSPAHLWPKDRLELRADGRLELTLKNVWKEGTRAVLLEPDDLLVRSTAVQRKTTPWRAASATCHSRVNPSQ